MNVPLFAALQRAEPKTFEALVQQLEEGYSQGAAEDEISSIMRSTVLAAAMRHLPYASDADLFKWTDILIGYMNGLKSADPESCVAIDDLSKGAKVRSNLQAQFPALIRDDFALKQILFKTHPFGTRSIPNTKDVQPYLARVFSNLSKRSDVKPSILSKDRLSPKDYSTYCATALAFYQELRRLPTNEASALLRNLYADASH
jgi:hypothetical protein